MHSPRFLRLSLLVLFLAAVVPAGASGKRRAVAHPTAGAVFTGTITGTVLDAVTGAPVVSATVECGGKSRSTDGSGKFRLPSVTGRGSFVVVAGRSGYTSKQETLTTNGDHEITIRLSPTPTVRVKKTDDTAFDADFESVEFGYVVIFTGYRKDEYEDFCATNGSSVTINRSEMRKITGPSTVVTDAPCCPGKQVSKINIELKTGQRSDYYFSDSCQTGETKMDLIARNHVTGQVEYIRFSDIKEIVFP